MDVAAVVKKSRQKAGLTQQELADKCGLHRSQITNIENGRHDPSLSRITLILRVLGKHITIE